LDFNGIYTEVYRMTGVFVRRALITAALSAWCGVAATPVLRAQQPAPDNTKINTRDRNSAQPTADQQTNNKTDLALTRQIRKAIVADKSLSTYAHNIKVITQNGKVTIKGPVRTTDEKTAVEAKAAAVAGQPNVVSEVSVMKQTARATTPTTKVHKKAGN
jgi:osmotically-inducible protein OsmY